MESEEKARPQDIAAGAPLDGASDPTPRPVAPTIPLMDFLSSGDTRLAKGPFAVVLIEDLVEVASTLSHAMKLGFRVIMALSPEPVPEELRPNDPKGRIIWLTHDSRRSDAHVQAVNAVLKVVPVGEWVSYFYNAEYLFYPFCETRTVGELAAFHAEERRHAFLTYVVDIYAADLQRHPSGVARDEAMLDRTGYFSLGRSDRPGEYKERQLDFFGGLRWRFEEFIPPDRRRIDRIALFRNKPGLMLLHDHRMNDEEYNTYSCPWHHNLTTAIASFRVAKALRRNPGSRGEVTNFAWRNSVPFRWNSQQLMEMGLIEPGQWF